MTEKLIDGLTKSDKFVRQGNGGCHGGNVQPLRTSRWQQPVGPLVPRFSCHDPVPMPPIWLNEYGQRAQTRSCPRPGCGREVPIRRYSHQTLRLIGWPLYRVASVVQWYGHRQEFISVADEGEWVRLVPIVGTAR